MLFLADIFFDVLHITVMLFNLFGWIPRRTRRVHRWLVAFTAFCWLVIGPAIGALGYCPLTDWHWRVKEMRGEKDLPSTYIDYLLRFADIHADPGFIQAGTGVVFAAVVLVTAVLWWRERKSTPAA